MAIRHFWALLAGAFLSLTAGCTTTGGPESSYRDRQPDGAYPVYQGGRYGDYGIGGAGAKHLDPWLSGTQPGTRLILAFYDRNYNGRIGIDRAGEANRWFRRFADRDHDLRVTDDEINRGLIALDAKLRRRGF